MMDPLGAAIQAVSAGSPSALALVLAAGVVSSFGPCAAPRFVAMAGLAADCTVTQGRRVSMAFVAGLAAAYASFGVFASSIGRITDLSPYIYGAVALGLACAGIATLLRQPSGCVGHAPLVSANASLGRSFLFGASFAFVISPCCTPIVIAILAYCTNIHSVAYAASLLGFFAVGHALPMFILSGSIGAISGFARRRHLDEPLKIVGGTLMLALSGYYLCLA